MAINETASLYPPDLINTKTTIPLRVGEERVDIYLDTSRLRMNATNHDNSLFNINKALIQRPGNDTNNLL